jgi:hypothetical protein
MISVDVIRDKDGIITSLTTDSNIPEIKLFLSLYSKFIDCFKVSVILDDSTRIHELTKELMNKDMEYQQKISKQLKEMEECHSKNILYKTQYLRDEIEYIKSSSNEKINQITRGVGLEHQIEREKLNGTIQNLNDKMKLQIEYNAKEICSMNDQLDQYRLIREITERDSTVMAKGSIGENYVFNHLMDKYIGDDYLVDKCSSKKEVGDILFKHKDYSICIESKNYASTVRTAQIIKFIRDVNNSRYDAGIIYNMNSTFVGKPLYHIEYTSENKPIIFISKLKENPIYIDISIKIILFILRNTSGKQKNTIDISFIINEIRNLITDNRDIQNTLNKSADRLVRLVDQLTEWKNE